MKPPVPAPRGNRRASTLVEVLVAIAILAVLAVGVGGYLAYSRALLSQQRDRRMALEVADARLEELRSTPCNQWMQLMGTNGLYYVKQDAGGWTVTNILCNEPRTVNTARATMTTSLRFDNAGWTPPFANPCDHIVMTVDLAWWVRATNRILLQTYYAPQP